MKIKSGFRFAVASMGLLPALVAFIGCEIGERRLCDAPDVNCVLPAPCNLTACPTGNRPTFEADCEDMWLPCDQKKLETYQQEQCLDADEQGVGEVFAAYCFFVPREDGGRCHLNETCFDQDPDRPLCINGYCAPSACGALTCDAQCDFVASKPACVDYENDPNNCGGFNLRCDLEEVCFGGVCTDESCASVTCPPEKAQCGEGGQCYDALSDVDNCGFFGNTCPRALSADHEGEGWLCVKGVCQPPLHQMDNGD